MRTDVPAFVAKYPDTWYTLAIIKNDERYIEYMKMLERPQSDKGGIAVDATLDRIENRGFQRGIRKGIELGVELSRRLQKEGRTEELERALADKDYMRELLGTCGMAPEESD